MIHDWLTYRIYGSIRRVLCIEVSIIINYLAISSLIPTSRVTDRIMARYQSLRFSLLSSKRAFKLCFLAETRLWLVFFHQKTFESVNKAELGGRPTSNKVINKFLTTLGQWYTGRSYFLRRLAHIYCALVRVRFWILQPSVADLLVKDPHPMYSILHTLLSHMYNKYNDGICCILDA